MPKVFPSQKVFSIRTTSPPLSSNKKDLKLPASECTILILGIFFCKSVIDSGELDVQYLKTQEMPANFLTKPLQGATFKKFRQEILGSRPTTSCGKQQEVSRSQCLAEK